MLSGFYVDAQEPITTGDSEPEPDVAIVRGRREDYKDKQPQATNVAVVAEVAARTLTRDRNFKKGIYARAGIPFYWIVNLTDRQIEVYSRPQQSDYTQRQIIAEEGELPVVIDGCEVGRIAVKEILP